MVGLRLGVLRQGAELIRASASRQRLSGCEPERPTFESAGATSGLRQVLESAIQEEPERGTTVLRLGFPASKTHGYVVDAQDPLEAGNEPRAGMRLSLRDLLHYLWDEGELSRRQPGFAGRRSWATVHCHLLEAGVG